jgi:molecular chaperone GrpE
VELASTVTESPDTPPSDPESGAGSPPDPVQELKDALQRAEATATENWNRYLRAVADLDNVRKRAAKDVDTARRSGVERFAQELLAVADTLELGLENAAKASHDDLLAGKTATLRLLRSAFDKFGVETVDPLGEPFNPQLHEAMSMQPSETAEPGSVLLVLQRGYRLGDRLLRPARVIVAGEPVVSGATVPPGDA